jgi:C-terminal processing protease CtpA/Prc
MNILQKTLILAVGLVVHAGSLAQEGHDPATNLTLEDLRTFSDVFNQVRSHYVEEMDERALLRAAIEGMVMQLDPWSKFMDAEQFRNFNNSSGVATAESGYGWRFAHFHRSGVAGQPGATGGHPGRRHVARH